MSDNGKNSNITNLENIKYNISDSSSIKNEIGDSESEKTISSNNSLTDENFSDLESNSSINDIETDVENDNFESFTCEADVAAYFFKCSNCNRYMIPYEEHEHCEDVFTDNTIDTYVTNQPSQNGDICMACETNHKQLLENEDINKEFSTDED